MAHILVLDGEPAVREQLRQMLTSCGHEAIAVETAPEAYLHIEAVAVDLLIADVHMPGSVNGLGLAHVARSLDPTLPILIISGKRVDQRELPSGSAWLRKPFTAAVLEEQIKVQLGTAQG